MTRRRLEIVHDDPHACYREFVGTLSTEYLACRANGHWWDVPQTARWHEDEKAYHVVELCSRCEQPRTSWLDGGGYVLSRHVGYEKAYLMPKDCSGVLPGERRAVARLQLLTTTSPNGNRKRRRTAS